MKMDNLATNHTNPHEFDLLATVKEYLTVQLVAVMGEQGQER